MIDKVVVQPVLWVVYITLPLFSGSLSTYPSLPAVPATCGCMDAVGSIPCFIFWTFFARLCWWLSTIYILEAIQRDYPLSFVIFFTFGFLVFLFFTLICFMWALTFGYYTVLLPFYNVVRSQWLIWLPLILICTLIKLLTQSMIIAFENRRSCQLLSLIASLLIGLLGSSNANKFLAIIPLVVGFILTFPDFDLQPGLEFKLRFTRFVTRNMDEESVQKLLDSKHCKMLCGNEMMPSLADLDSPVFSCFLEREDRQYCDSIVNPRYEIGLGSVTTWSNEHQIDVVITTPHCGIKRMTMRNTALSRYNLHKSAGFWRDNPRLGILNHGDVKTHCISTEEWIKCCGSEEFIFVNTASV